MDKKNKTIVAAVAAVLMIVAGITSYDFNPISVEQLDKAEKEVLATENFDTNEDGEAVIHQKNKFCVGEEIEIMKPDFTNEFVKVESIRSEENGQMDSAPHPKQKVWVKLSGNPSAQDLLRRKEKRGETNES